MSSWQTCALRPILELRVEKCQSQTQRTVLGEVLGLSRHACFLPVSLEAESGGLHNGGSFDQGALKKVRSHTWRASPEMRRQGQLARRGSRPHCQLLPLQKGLGEEDSIDGTQLLSYLITMLPNFQICQNVEVLGPFPH